MFEDLLGKPEMSSPPPWLRDKLFSFSSPGGSERAVSPSNTELCRMSPRPDSQLSGDDSATHKSLDKLECQSQQLLLEGAGCKVVTPCEDVHASQEHVTSAPKLCHKIETEFPASNDSPKMKHVSVIYHKNDVGATQLTVVPKLDHNAPSTSNGQIKYIRKQTITVAPSAGMEASPGQELLKLSDSFSERYLVTSPSGIPHLRGYELDSDSDEAEGHSRPMSHAFSVASTVSLSELLERELDDLQTPLDEDTADLKLCSLDTPDDVSQSTSASEEVPSVSEAVECVAEDVSEGDPCYDKSDGNSQLNNQKPIKGANGTLSPSSTTSNKLKPNAPHERKVNNETAEAEKLKLEMKMEESCTSCASMSCESNLSSSTDTVIANSPSHSNTSQSNNNVQANLLTQVNLLSPGGSAENTLNNQTTSSLSSLHCSSHPPAAKSRIVKNVNNMSKSVNCEVKNVNRTSVSRLSQSAPVQEQLNNTAVAISPPEFFCAREVPGFRRQNSQNSDTKLNNTEPKWGAAKNVERQHNVLQCDTSMLNNAKFTPPSPRVAVQRPNSLELPRKKFIAHFLEDSDMSSDEEVRDTPTPTNPLHRHLPYKLKKMPNDREEELPEPSSGSHTPTPPGEADQPSASRIPQSDSKVTLISPKVKQFLSQALLVTNLRYSLK